MNSDYWNFFKLPRRRMSESRLLRYGIAVLLPVLAVLVIYARPVFTETPFFIFLGAVALSAANGGLATGFVTTALSAFFIRLLFVGGDSLLHFGGNLNGVSPSYW